MKDDGPFEFLDDLTVLSDEELDDYTTGIAVKIDEFRAQAVKGREERSRRAELEQAKRIVEGLSDSQRAALAQVAVPEGIESQEAVGEQQSNG